MPVEEFTDGEKVSCPHSAEMMDHFAPGYVLHFATPEELAANGGVCAKCRASFKHGNGNFLQGKEELPIDPGQRIEHVANNADKSHQGNECDSVEFDFDAVERALGDIDNTPEDACAMAADVFSRIMEWVWAPCRVNAALVRFTALSAAMRPDLMSKTYEQLGMELGVSKQAISKYVLQAQTAFGLKFTRTRSNAARANMSKAMEESHRRRTERGSGKMS